MTTSSLTNSKLRTQASTLVSLEVWAIRHRLAEYAEGVNPVQFIEPLVAACKEVFRRLADSQAAVTSLNEPALVRTSLVELTLFDKLYQGLLADKAGLSVLLRNLLR